MTLAAGKGLIRSMLVEGSNHAEASKLSQILKVQHKINFSLIVPVDFCINGLIIVAWYHATCHKKYDLYFYVKFSFR